MQYESLTLTAPLTAALDSVLGVGPAGAVDLPIEHGLKRIVESLERAF